MEVSGSLGVYISLFLALYFEVFLLIAFLEKRPEKRSMTLPKHYPAVCIIVPCFNEVQTIGKTLESLLGLQYPKGQLSIMVVDDGSQDGTGAIAKSFAAQYEEIRYFYKENGGKYTALNFGIERTSAEFVGCLDADSFVAPEGLNEMIKKFESDPTIYALTPAMKVSAPRNILELMQTAEYTFGIFCKKMFDNLSAIQVLPGPFSIYRRVVFEKIGLFRRAHNTEDMEIAFRMHSHKLKIANAHTVYVYTTVPASLGPLIRQRTRWVQGFLQNSLDYRYMYFNPRFGNFGNFVLPLGLTASLLGIYTASYSLYRLFSFISSHLFNLQAGIPLHLSQPTLSWFYLNTSMMTFLVVITLGMTFTALLLGQRIAQNKLPIQSILYYFTLFGLIAPIWLARAVWGTVWARESTWR